MSVLRICNTSAMPGSPNRRPNCCVWNRSWMPGSGIWKSAGNYPATSVISAGGRVPGRLVLAKHNETSVQPLARLDPEWIPRVNQGEACEQEHPTQQELVSNC